MERVSPQRGGVGEQPATKAHALGRHRYPIASDGRNDLEERLGMPRAGTMLDVRAP